MSTAIAINVEPEEDEEVEQTEEANEQNDDEGEEQEENGENSVGDEEEGEPQPPPKRRRKKKRSFNYRPWICGFVVLLVIGLSIGLGIYFGRGPTGPSCHPMQNYTLLGDDLMEPHTKVGYKIAVFSGQVTHDRMFSICERINETERRGPGILDKWRGAIHLNKADEEKQFDDIITKYDNRVFQSGMKKLMWMGDLFEFNAASSKWEAKFEERLKENNHTNFCNQSWKSDAETKGKSLDKNKKEKIYIVKNYKQVNNCWELYTAKELANFTGQPADRSPRLPFACSFYHDGKLSGKDTVPGTFTPKYTVGKYTFYNASATFEDAKKECEAHNSHLIQFKDQAEMKTLYDSRAKIQSFTDSDLFWSGVYIDVSNGNNNSMTYSPTWKETVVAEDAAALEKAAMKLIDSIKNDKLLTRDCASHYVYAGMSFKEVGADKRIKLRAINAEGQLDQDRFTAYVACEKNVP